MNLPLESTTSFSMLTDPRIYDAADAKQPTASSQCEITLSSRVTYFSVLDIEREHKRLIVVSVSVCSVVSDKAFQLAGKIKLGLIHQPEHASFSFFCRLLGIICVHMTGKVHTLT